MAKTKTQTRPNDGGSYKRNKDGSYTRLDTPQKPDPGKTARRKQEAAKKANNNAPATAAQATSNTTGKKE